MSRRATAFGFVLGMLFFAILAVQHQPPMTHYRSTTYCAGGRAFSDEPMPGARPVDSIETIAHEGVHRRQLAPGCDSVLVSWERSLAAKMTAEAEALCVGMRAAGLSDTDRRKRAVTAALWWSQWRGEWSFAEYLAMFNLWCIP